jgi:hypothetical protein
MNCTDRMLKKPWSQKERRCMRTPRVLVCLSFACKSRLADLMASVTSALKKEIWQGARQNTTFGKP